MYPEPFEDIAFAALEQRSTVRELPKEKWIYGLLLEFEGRTAVTVAAPGAVLPEAPQSIVEEILVEGQHKILGERKLYRMHGATAFRYATIYSPPGRQPGRDDGGLANATGNYDWRFYIPVIFPLERLPISEQIRYMLKGSDWRTLNLRITWGDRTSLFNALTGTVAHTAFGAATGNPRCRVHLLRPLLGEARDKIVPAIVSRKFRDMTTILTDTNLTDALIAELNIGKQYRSLLIKTGVRATAAPPTGGVNVFVSLSDGIITRPKIKLDGKEIRNSFDTATMKEYTEWALGQEQAVGYTLIDFAEHGSEDTLFPGQSLTKENRFEFHGDVTVAANQRGELVETEVEGVSGIVS